MIKRVPGYRHHKPSGLAVVTIDGKDHYLGPVGSVESHAAYGRLIADHSSGKPVTSKPVAVLNGFSINEIVLAFLKHAKKHYVKNGKLTSEYGCFLSAVRPLIDLYGDTQASGDAGFTASKLRAVRDKMIELGWSRKYINKSCVRIRQVFRFAMSHDMLGTSILGAAVITSLESLESLQPGRSDAVELPERKPVPDDHIEAVRAKVNKRTRDMIDLCLQSGARPGEIVSLTTAIIDRSQSDVWTAELVDHKMKHKNKKRKLAFGPESIAILKRYLKSSPNARLFPIRRDTFTKTIRYWCDKLGLPKFTAHWLRHNAGTRIRKLEGLDGAQAVLGHSDQKTTQIYAHIEDTAAVEIARKHG